MPVRAFARLSGLGEHTLRAWERRYRALEPRRASSGQRLYSISELERARLLVRAVRQGHPIGRIARLSLVELEQLLKPSDLPPSTPPEVSLPIVSKILEAMDREDARKLAFMLDKAQNENDV